MYIINVTTIGPLSGHKIHQIAKENFSGNIRIPRDSYVENIIFKTYIKQGYTGLQWIAQR